MNDKENPFDIPKPTDLNIPIDEMKQKAQQAYNEAPPEVKQAVEKSQSFYEAHKKEIHLALAGAVVLRIYKKKISKATAKAVVKAIASEKFDPVPTLPTMFDIWSDLKRTPGLAYIPHGEKMVHLLGPSKDVVITVFGDFTKMDTDEIFRYAGKALGIRGY